VPRFTVVWATDVQDDFLEHWLISDRTQRRFLTDLANAIDRELAFAPVNRGSPLPSEPALRVWSIPQARPTASVVFEILAEDRLVRVLRIAISTP
jgi:hypothetical protein